MIKYILSILLFSIAIPSFSQTGPGGVGNSTDNKLWLDANRLGLANGARVYTWTDFSGNGYSASQNNYLRTPNYTTNAVNGRAALNFSGNKYMETPANSALNTNNLSWFVVGRINDLTSSNTFLRANYISGAGTNSNVMWGTFRWQTSGKFHSHAATSTGSLPGVTYSSSTSTNLHSAIWNGPNFEAFQNGTSAGTRSDLDAIPAGHNFIRIGAHSNAITNYLNGSISEIIVYNTVVNVSKRRIIENYLSSKYNLSIAGDLYAFDASGGHGYEVAGIGQTSITDNHTVARGSGRVQISTPSLLTDGDFLLWGHNNLALTLNTTDVPTGFIGGERLERTWRAGHTGNLGTVTVRVDLTGVEFNSSSLALYIDNDGNFADATAHTTGFVFDSNTNIATFTNVTLNNGNYFTVGTAGPIISVASGIWINPTTWNCLCVPDTNNTVVIMPGHTVTIDPTGDAENLINNGTLDFLPNGVLSLYRHVENNGVINFSEGTIEFVGFVEQRFNASVLTSLRNITINNSDGLLIESGTIELYGVLEIVNGNLDNSANNPFTLISNVNGDARIGAIPSGSNILGDFTVQRRVAAGATGYRFLTSPVSGKTLADWNDDFEMRGFTGIFNGTTNGDPSIYYYVEALSNPSDANGYQVPASISHPLNEGEALWAYMGTGQSTTAPINIDVTGPLYIGTRSLSSNITYTDHSPAGPDAHDGWNLVGNPFVSTINWNNLSRTNLHNRIQIWNPNTGSYGVYNGNTATSTNGVTNLIASSQGFYVQANGSGTPLLSIPENSKSAINGTFIRTALTSSDAFKLNLSNNSNAYSDEIIVSFNTKASKGYDDGDILKLSVPDKSASYIATKSDNVLLAYNSLPESLDEYFIPLVVKGGSAARYTISFENISALTDKYNVFLKDLNNEVKLDISKELAYEFNITDPASEKNLVLHIVSKSLSGDVVLSSELTRKDNEQVNIYSAPGIITVNFDLEKQSDAIITVHNLLGQQMFTQNVAAAHKNNVILNSNLANGIYIISVETKELKVARKINL
ncbi:MAG: T9SS type A sorting domain-containing protein [Bacteroidota bacterium]|nr:T9SS type A sorting domain-containing protein [Bacteroidota bacterium]